MDPETVMMWLGVALWVTPLVLLSVGFCAILVFIFRSMWGD